MPAVKGIAGSCPSKDSIQDYLDMATLYKNEHQYQKALDYIEMIEPYDEFNTEIMYQKAELQNSLNRLVQSEKTLNQLIGLNFDYACSPLSMQMDEYNGKRLCKSQKPNFSNDNLAEVPHR